MSSLKLPPDTPTIESQPEYRKYVLCNIIINNRRKRSDIENKDIHKQIERKRTRRLNDAMYKLHKLLKEQGIDLKKDKISILSHTLEYIKELHKKLKEQKDRVTSLDVENDDNVDIEVDSMEIGQEENEQSDDNDEDDGDEDDEEERNDIDIDDEDDLDRNNENDDNDEKMKQNYLFSPPPQQSPLGSPLSSSFVFSLLLYVYIGNITTFKIPSNSNKFIEITNGLFSFS